MQNLIPCRFHIEVEAVLKSEGLRATKEQCKMRAGEMVQTLSTVPLPMPPPYSAGFRCEIGEET